MAAVPISLGYGILRLPTHEPDQPGQKPKHTEDSKSSTLLSSWLHILHAYDVPLLDVPDKYHESGLAMLGAKHCIHQPA